MKQQTIEALEQACEGLINFIAAEKPNQRARDKALKSLIQLREALPLEAVES